MSEPKSSEGLKACPFCGADDAAIAHYTRVGSNDAAGYYVECCSCSAGGESFDVQGEMPDRHEYTKAKAIAAWNRRPPSPQQEPSREAVARIIDPGVFRELDNQAGFPPESIERSQNRRTSEAFAKADAILALKTAKQEPVAWRLTYTFTGEDGVPVPCAAACDGPEHRAMKRAGELTGRHGFSNVRAEPLYAAPPSVPGEVVERLKAQLASSDRDAAVEQVARGIARDLGYDPDEQVNDLPRWRYLIADALNMLDASSVVVVQVSDLRALLAAQGVGKGLGNG